MSFQKFTDTKKGRGRPQQSEMMLSLRKSGSIGINRVTMEEFFDQNDGAVMYYSQETKQIGIEPVESAAADDAAYTVTKSDASGTISAQAFLRQYDLVPEQTTQYTPEWDEDAELLVVDIENPTKTYGAEE